MTQENASDVLPMLTDAHRGFDQALRGYDRSQVDQYFGQQEDELRATIAERDAATARSADLAAQLASAQAQIESLRRQLRTATETVTADNSAITIKDVATMLCIFSSVKCARAGTMMNPPPTPSMPVARPETTPMPPSVAPVRRFQTKRPVSRDSLQTLG